MRVWATCLLLLGCTATMSELTERTADLTPDSTFEWPELKHDVWVLNTDGAIPHVYGSIDTDVRVVQGYLMARDRFFQIDTGRRLAQGTLGELVGEAAVAMDVESRTQGMARISDTLFDSLGAAELDDLEAFTAGINHYVDAVKLGTATPPSEYTFVSQILDQDATQFIERLTPRDVVAFMTVPVFQMGFTNDDLVRTELEAGLASRIANKPDAALRRAGALSDILDNVAPLTQTVSVQRNSARAATDPQQPDSTPRLQSSGKVGSSLLASLNLRLAKWSERWGGGVRRQARGSNAWAVRTDDGVIVANDGHLQLSMAPIMYTMDLDTQVGGGSLKTAGQFFAGVPYLLSGTNGNMAWGQTYLYGDPVDWFKESITLGPDGLPRYTRYRSALNPISQITERYAFRELGGTEIFEREHVRFETASGRPIVSVEGEPANAESAGALFIAGSWVIPKDMNDDGDIEAISFDYAAFEVGALPKQLKAMGAAPSADAMLNIAHRTVAFTQNRIIGDRDGHIAYTGASATPCRSELRDEFGNLRDDPTRLLDGTRTPGFEIPLDDNHEPTYDQSGIRCLIAPTAWPTTVDPNSGYVLNANNDVAGSSLDGSLLNDTPYIGGPWTTGLRAHTIETELRNGASTMDAHRALQNNHQLPLAERFIESMRSAIARTEASIDDNAPDALTLRLQTLQQAHGERLEEAMRRLNRWVDRGAHASSGVVTFYQTEVSDDDAADSVATMIFHAWYRAFFRRVLEDEDLDDLLRYRQNVIPRLLLRILNTRGELAPHAASHDESRGESVFFDDVRTEDVQEHSDEIVVLALVDALEWLSTESNVPGKGGFGTDDMNAWRWGERHQAVFDSLLRSFAGDSDNALLSLLGNALSLKPEEVAGAEELRGQPGFPRPGGFWTVDAGNPDHFSDDYTFRNGAVMRSVIELKADGARLSTVIPGGQSGVRTSPHYTDQLEQWLGNRTYDVPLTLEEVINEATAIERFRPARAQVRGGCSATNHQNRNLWLLLGLLSWCFIRKRKR